MKELEIKFNGKQNDSHIIEQLKQEEYPLYIWGIGNVANEVYEILQENDVALAGAFIDVLSNQQTKFKDYPVQSLQELHQRGQKISVIMGHAQYHKMRDLKEYSIIENVYYILNPFRTHEEISQQFYEENKNSYLEGYNLFEEEYSQKVFESFLNTRINSDIKYLLDVFQKPINFFDNDVFQVNENENMVDIGAYTGDTIEMLCRVTGGKYRNIYAFEPDTHFFEILNQKIENKHWKNVYTYQLGIWNEDTVLSFEADNQQSGRLTEEVQSECKIEVVSLDHILAEKEVSCIKVAISTGNYQVLLGAKNIIQKYRPKIAMIIGINKTDIYEIPLLLRHILPEYQLYLRYCESMPSRLTLFAV